MLKVLEVNQERKDLKEELVLLENQVLKVHGETLVMLERKEVKVDLDQMEQRDNQV